MFFPVGDQNIVKGNKPILTYFLLAINIAIFVFQFSLSPQAQQEFVFTYGSIPREIMHGEDLFTLFTCMFLHGGWMHLIGNMMFLWVFADNIESTVGSFRFLLFYLAAGIAASLAHSILGPNSNIPCVGASGAIAGVLGAYLVMFPKSQIQILFVVFLRTFSVSAIYFLGFWIVQQFMSGIGSLSATTIVNSGVAYWAHIGGFVFGVLGGFFMRSKAKQMTLSV
jgi:membrane associated rhomboid family serine protease